MENFVHPLEHNEAERIYFSDILQRRTSGLAPGAYRRAVEVLTNGLPTWAERAKPGPKRSAGKSR